MRCAVPVLCLNNTAVMGNFKFHRIDLYLTIFGLFGLLSDAILDIFTAVEFYKAHDFIRLGVFVFFLLVSSVLVQSFSWLWYKYDKFEMKTKVEKVPTERSLLIMHFLQLGSYLRHIGVIEMAVCKYLALKGGTEERNPGHVAVMLSHDVAMLRLVETFSESLPHFILMITTKLQEEQMDTILGIKAISLVAVMTISILSYQRSLRSFLEDKKKHTTVSSVVYFLWNLLLLAARVAALCLFTSVLPGFIAAHFLCSWTVLFIIVWCCQTDFMDSKGGEVLYRGTVALFWYFNWFNVVKGKTLKWTALYHGYMLLDIMLLCGHIDVMELAVCKYLAVKGVDQKLNPGDVAVTLSIDASSLADDDEEQWQILII
ncbi:hypothetical protein WMY93_019066 [Mugilogobius chulae]|uniref:XK-related protein n=1 Tax=Mugilogobius chulae TaxID=88201 RepID=A0AAW0NEA1_9GOBI